VAISAVKDYWGMSLPNLRCIILVALVLRVAFPVLVFGLNKDVQVFYDNDTIEYIEPATSLIKTGLFRTNGVPEIERTPAYPLLLIPGIISGHIELVTIALQIILSCLCVFMVYQIGTLLFDSHEISLLCAGLYAVEPLTTIYCSRLYSETLYVTLLLVFLYFLIRHLKTGAVSDLLLSAVALAATTYVRPISYFMPPLIAFALVLWALLRRSPNRKLILHAGLFFLVSMSIIAVWQVRNRVETGYSGFSAISDQNLYFYVGGGILAEKNGIDMADQLTNMGYGVPETYLKLHPEQRTWSRAEIYRYRGKEGVKWVVENLRTFFKLAVENTITTLRETGTTDLLDMFKVDQASPDGARLKWILKLPLFVVLLGYWLLAAIGIFSKRWANGEQLMVLIVVGAYLIFIASMGGIGYSRFRHPVMPIICLMAGCGLFVTMQRPIRVRFQTVKAR
jgi:4-amino-4-deoxy-L-arabinose transferase-like glycosyltransferase